MKLYEFFGSLNTGQHDPRDTNNDGKLSQEEKEQFKRDLFFYIIDNDKLHKTQFYDVTENIYADKKVNDKVWLPMVNKGCMEYYRERKLQDDPKDLFAEEFREELCQMLDDHYRKDVLKGIYKAGK